MYYNPDNDQTSAIPRHREINAFLARKICRDLGVPEPESPNEADRWDGGKDFATSATDAYGRSVSASIEKGILSYTLEVRSNGPDGLSRTLTTSS